MSPSPRLTRPVPRAWLPRGTVRLRLTLLYGCLFLISGAALLTITYLLVRRSTGTVVRTPSGVSVSAPAGAQEVPKIGLSSPPQAVINQLEAARAHQHANELHQLLVQSGIALAIMTTVSIVLGWLVAGRVLRPLRTMTETARAISAHNLSERLALPGPRDELKALGDTIDDLLVRLESAFDAQRRFVANASHELRTPLTMIRTSVDVATRKPGIVPPQVTA